MNFSIQLLGIIASLVVGILLQKVKTPGWIVGIMIGLFCGYLTGQMGYLYAQSFTPVMVASDKIPTQWEAVKWIEWAAFSGFISFALAFLLFTLPFPKREVKSIE